MNTAPLVHVTQCPLAHMCGQLDTEMSPERARELRILERTSAIDVELIKDGVDDLDGGGVEVE